MVYKEKSSLKDFEKIMQVIEQSPNAIIMTDTEGVIEYSNPKFTEITGYSQTEVLGKKPNILKSDKSVTDYNDLWSTITSGKEWQGEFYNRKKNGNYFWEMASIAPIKDEQGQIINYVAIKKDITKRKEYEKELLIRTQELKEIKEQLAENEKILSKIFDLSMEAICYVDKDFKIIKTNKRYDKLSQLHLKHAGLDLKELQEGQLRCYQLLCTEKCNTEQCSLAQILSGKDFLQDDVKINIADEIYYFIVTVVPYTDDSGNLLGMLQSYRDITDRKKKEIELNKRIDLENLILNLSKDFINFNNQDFASLIEQSLEEIAKFIGADYAYIYLFSNNQTEIRESFIWQSKAFDIENTISKQGEINLEKYQWTLNKLKQGEIINLADINNLPQVAISLKELLSSNNVKSTLMLPLEYGKFLLGVLGFDATTERKEWEEEEISLFKVVADIFINLIERKLNEDKLHFQLEFQRLVAEISADFVNIELEELDKTINKSLKLLAELFEVERSYLFQYSDDAKSLTNTHEWTAKGVESERERWQEIPADKQEWINQQVFNLDIINIYDIEELSQQAISVKEAFKKESIKSVLVVPMLLNSEKTKFGFIGFDSLKKKKRWDEKHISLLKVVAETIASALIRESNEKKLADYYIEIELQNMELERLYGTLEAEFEKASQLHQQFLPNDLPEINDLSYATYFQPAVRVGGDFYNVVKIKDQLLIYLADVSGHGLDSAMLNIFLRETINSYLLYEQTQNKIISPNQMIKFIAQRYLKESFPDDYFICLLLGVVDLKEMKFSFANAGFQIPPILISQGQNLSLLSCGGIFISSVVGEEEFIALNQLNQPEKELFLEPGDTLFLTTDGLIEESVAGERYGIKRLKDILLANSNLPAEIIAKNIKTDFEQFSGSLESTDDITFLALKYDLNLVAELKKRFLSDFDKMYDVEAEIAKFITPYTDEAELLCLGVHEMLINAIEHGNGLDSTKEVVVEIEVEKEYIKISIKDQGSGFKWYNNVNKELDLGTDLNQERGRGIKITRKLYDEIWYNQSGNQVNLLKLRVDN